MWVKARENGLGEDEEEDTVEADVQHTVAIRESAQGARNDHGGGAEGACSDEHH